MRKAAMTTLAVSLMMIELPNAQTISSTSDAFKAGQDFANGSKGKGAASGTVNATTGNANVPKYNTDAPESSNYGGGKSLIGGAGSGKVTGCQTYTAGNAYDQQECNAVNWLNKMDRTNNFIINKTTDPLMVGSKSTISNPGTIPATGTSACHIETETIPGTYTTETCEESAVLTSFTCKKTLLPQCDYIASPITTHSENRTGAFDVATITQTGTTGLYDYLAQANKHCGTEGAADINFNLDTIGLGGYITINLSNLDDTAAIAVNGTTVFAGHPNSGPQYSSDLFPSSHKGFQIGYSWSEDVGSIQCVATDWDGNCTQTAWVPNVMTFYANNKLLDYCPSGYSPRSQKDYQYCDGDGNCYALDSYSPNNVQGFFCNVEGKFLLNRHEGSGAWGGSVSTIMPLEKGMNKIQVYWGTSQSGKACGQVTVSGQIYNVAPNCTTSWDDQCAPARAAVKVE